MADGRLVAIGEALIDFIPSPAGCAFDEVESFFPAVGGAPANVCAVFSRLGGRSLFLTQLGDDPFGHKILNTLSETGIDTSYVALTGKANTALAFVSLGKDGSRTFSFYRNPSADMLYTPDQLDEAAFEDIFALHFCSVSLGDYPMKDAHVRAIEMARGNGALISFDPNLRFMLWKDEDRLRSVVNEFIPKADILKISDDELEFVTGEKDIDQALPGLFSKGIRLVLFTCGSEGMKAYTPICSSVAKAPEVKAVDTTGAGDASIGSFLWKIKSLGYDASNLDDISMEDLQKATEFAVRYCAVSVQGKGAIPSYPRAEDL